MKRLPTVYCIGIYMYLMLERRSSSASAAPNAQVPGRGLQMVFTYLLFLEHSDVVGSHGISVRLKHHRLLRGQSADQVRLLQHPTAV